MSPFLFLSLTCPHSHHIHLPSQCHCPPHSHFIHFRPNGPVCRLSHSSWKFMNILFKSRSSYIKDSISTFITSMPKFITLISSLINVGSSSYFSFFMRFLISLIPSLSSGPCYFFVRSDGMKSFFGVKSLVLFLFCPTW